MSRCLKRYTILPIISINISYQEQYNELFNKVNAIKNWKGFHENLIKDDSGHSSFYSIP